VKQNRISFLYLCAVGVHPSQARRSATGNNIPLPTYLGSSYTE